MQIPRATNTLWKSKVKENTDVAFARTDLYREKAHNRKIRLVL